tara:strand:+ start:9896 stop:10999 length:1104 start_codon:yes stop_codon:yes gene_type:complete
MNSKALKLVLVSTPIGFVGSGKGGGVEVTLISLIRGLVSFGHKVTLIAPEGSHLPKDCSDVEIKYAAGIDQPSWQHQEHTASVKIPSNGLLPRLLELAIELGENSDAILNFSYDWLPIWIGQFLDVEIFHLISMGDVSQAITQLINHLAPSHSYRFAFHTYRQASDYEALEDPIIVGNGFDMSNYKFQPGIGGPLGWAGRVAPEKGLEDALEVAASLGEKLLIWGLVDDANYARKLKKLFSEEIIEFRGFLSTSLFQKELGTCRVLLNTPKWNEAYGNVVIESMACGVPVIAYDRGGPGELITSGINGFVVPPDDTQAMKLAVSKIGRIDRNKCRKSIEESASYKTFAKRIEDWIINGINKKNMNNK